MGLEKIVNSAIVRISVRQDIDKIEKFQDYIVVSNLQK